MANYLYNGVVLPELPEWDNETYPFAIITIDQTDASRHYFRVYDDIPYHDADTLADDGSSCLVFTDGEAKQFYWRTRDDGWTKQKYVATTSDRIVASGLLWTNTDILNADGTLYLAASDPIPVGGEPIDKASFLQGYIVGRRLAGMRK